MRKPMCLLIGVFLLAGCAAGPFYKNRLCKDVGYDFYHTMNYCERAWYDHGMSYEGAQKWCSTPRSTPLPPSQK